MLRARLVATLVIAVGLAGCADQGSSTEPAADRTLVLAGYSATRDVFDRALIPAFEADYRARTGKTLRVRSSYLASGAQSRAVVSGFEADVVALALEPDVARIEKAGLILHDVRKGERRGVFTTSIVALAVRPGNPKRIEGWADLAKPGLDVLMPNPKTSGGAMWNVSALYGAALAGGAGVPKGDDKAAAGLLRAVLRNVAIMDKGARESLITFEKGVGDVAVTYESEVFAGRMAGRTYDLVIPSSTIVVEAMAAVVDGYVDRHGVRAEAEAFVNYLYSKDAQRALARYGFRSEDAEVMAEHAASFPKVESPFRIDALGGWGKVVPSLFGKEGVFPRTWELVYAEE
ncbi:sulfate ABC transporter substrate-binding protein [Polyangium aurulentum]|uniref:sulfate ABC transporter substrate-binding protein n=1 Tax=Polyangium aurulentum TaxID=2567896 RepID=UPI0010ADB98E|nr:sulfate ABC transporter substrate-binding protein [Polyangium aurulentum]UQA61065.1 sulfate ABC transporter substrate-binding protein [Polyangium aurulentum]